MGKKQRHLTEQRHDAPERLFDDVSVDVRLGLQRELVAGLDLSAMLRLATRRAVALRMLELEAVALLYREERGQ